MGHLRALHLFKNFLDHVRSVALLLLGIASLAFAAESGVDARPRPPWPDAPAPLVDLGKALFFDSRLSADNKTSCSSCHQPQRAFQDGRTVAIGAFGQNGNRNTPSLLRVTEQRTLFWDGRRQQLDTQALDPLLNSREHGLATEDDLSARLAAIPEYRPMFDAARMATHADVHDIELLKQALAAYQHQLSDGSSPFERFLYDKDMAAISPSALRGWKLFSGRAACVSCHHISETAPALFTDHGFHALPFARASGPGRVGELARHFLTMRASGTSIEGALASSDDMAALGRFAVTEDPSDIGSFKTPSLRNVALTAPYMHDGSLPTLEDAINQEIYYRGTRDGRPLILTEPEKADLLSFLHTLTSYKSPE